MNERRFGFMVPALVASAVAAGLFVILAWCLHEKNRFLIEFDAHFAEALHEYKQTAPGATSFFDKVTHLGSVETLILVVLLTGVVGWRWRHWWLVAAWLVSLIGGEYLNSGLKGVFERPRPPFAKKADWSFPSGHAQMSMICYGMLVYALVLLWPHRAWRIALVVLLILLIGFSRLLLGAHYPSDVLGGFAAGAAWLGIWIAGIEAVRAGSHKAAERPARPEGGPTARL
jgi:undecaprenyl-diphosphatase